MSARGPAARLAVDIGGTFTDIVLLDGERRFVSKVLTTPRAPELAVIDGTRSALGSAGLAFADIGLFVHGTTLATNAIIERKGARTALIATDGFRDVIEIADESRFDQYDINIVKTPPLVPRELRFTVPERLDVHGAVRLALDEQAVRQVAKRIADTGIEAIAVALIHAYANPAHEQRVGAILAELYPGISVSLSSAVSPEAREYERTSTTIANAYVQPLMAGYLKRLQRAFTELGYTRPIHLMTSGGSLASLETAAQFPVRLVESGPAGGAILAGHIALGARREPHPVLRHGRHHRQDLPDRQRPAAQGPRLRGRPPVALQEGQRHAAAHPRHRDGGDRRRRRLDRPRRRPAAHPGRTRQRRRRARPRLLRPRRHASRPSPTPTSPSARSTSSASPAARSRSIPTRRRPRSPRPSRACRPSRAPSASPRSSTRTWPTPPACTPSSAASPSPSAR